MQVVWVSPSLAARCCQLVTKRLLLCGPQEWLCCEQAVLPSCAVLCIVAFILSTELLTCAVHDFVPVLHLL